MGENTDILRQMNKNFKRFRLFRPCKLIGKRLSKNVSLTIAIIILAFIILPILFAPLLGVQDPTIHNLDKINKPPSWMEGGSRDNLLGTDFLGRDLLSRILYGGRNSLIIAGGALLLSLSFGTLLGTFAGYFGGKVDTAIQRLIELQIAFPFIILALAILTVFPIRIQTLIFVLFLSTWAAYARTFRGIVLVESKKLYIVGAKAIGEHEIVIIFKYLLRNIMPTILVLATVDLAFLITMEAAISFVGLGVQPPKPSWGNIIGEGKKYIDIAWWIATMPGVFLILLTFGLNLLSDSLEK
jgi:peptide/nickel transport system permease protein